MPASPNATGNENKAVSPEDHRRGGPLLTPLIPPDLRVMFLVQRPKRVVAHLTVHVADRICLLFDPLVVKEPGDLQNLVFVIIRVRSSVEHPYVNLGNFPGTLIDMFSKPLY